MTFKRNKYQTLAIRLNLLKADCQQALNHARAVEFSQDSQAVESAHRQYVLVRLFANDLMNDCPDELPVNDPLIVDTMGLLNDMNRQLRSLRRQ